MSKERVLLPTNVKPTNYALTITPNLTNFTFKGSEVISINVIQGTRTITLHAYEIDIISAKVVSLALRNNQSQSARIAYDEEGQTVTLTVSHELAARTTATLHIEYTGTLNDKMAGFYRSSYKERDGRTRYMISTQFEPVDARRAFPSWDEPAIKATFDITLIVPENLTALSNMDVVGETQHGDGTKEVKFSKTPIMSTYLVAFVVGDLGYIEAYTAGDNNGKSVPVRVYALKGEERHGEFALGVAKKALEYFAEVFGTPYPLPKCDLVAVPDFESGAMENWGLMTFRTNNFLFDNKESDVMFKYRIAYTVSHETSHQWFGNLATMEWWDYLWLNEGFATWIGYLAADKFYPEMQIWNRYVNDAFQRALALDSLRSSHPVEVPVKNPSEINQKFDAISYFKGGNVIRMISNFLGEDVFFAGVRKYLARHRFGNGSSGDLWAALEEESGNDVRNFMAIWTKETGYPVLNVEEVEANHTLRIKQCRFLSSGASSTEEEEEPIWWVPLNIDFGPFGKPTVIITQKEMPVVIPDKCDFYLLNAGKTGFFRVNYPPERLSKLGEAVKKGLIDTADRVGIIADAGALASSGYGKTSGLLSFIQAFQDEDRYIVWSEISNRLSNLLSVWFEQPEPIYQGLLKFQRELVSNLVERVGWDFPENEGYLATVLRALIIRMSGKAIDPNTVREAHRRFQAFTKRSDENALHPTIRGTVFEIVLSNGGGIEEFDAILRYYRETRAPDQVIASLIGLGFAYRDDLIERALKFSTTDEVRSQDVMYSFDGLQKNRKSRRALWNYVKEHWYTIHGQYSKAGEVFERIIKYSTESLSSEDDVKDIETFFSNKNCKEFDRALKQSIENVRANAAWIKRDSQDVEDWLKSNGYIQ